jgi:hypothetical protein
VGAMTTDVELMITRSLSAEHKICYEYNVVILLPVTNLRYELIESYCFAQDLKIRFRRLFQTLEYEDVMIISTPYFSSFSQSMILFGDTYLLEV